MVLFTEPSDNCRRRYMHSTECPSSCIYTLQRTLTAISVRVHLGYNHNNQPLPQWQIHCMLCLVCYVIQLRISCGASGVFWQTYVAGYSWSRVKNTNGLTVHTIMTGLAAPKPTPLYIAVGGTDQSLLFLFTPIPPTPPPKKSNRGSGGALSPPGRQIEYFESHFSHGLMDFCMNQQLLLDDLALQKARSQHKTRRLAVTERPRDASCHWISYSRSMTGVLFESLSSGYRFLFALQCNYGCYDTIHERDVPTLHDGIASRGKNVSRSSH